MSGIPISPELRFWPKVRKLGPTDCWLWKASRLKSGYGSFSGVRPKKWRAHCFAWFITNGLIPEDKVICHKCDNKLCVNPKHLFLGTQAANLADMRKKNRGAIGSMLPQTKLTPAKVAYIRNSFQSERVLAKKFKVSYTTINAVRNRQTFKYLP